MFVGGMARLPRAPRVPSRLRAYAPAPQQLPAWLPAVGSFADIGTSTLNAVKPSGWPTSESSGPFMNWSGGAWAPDFGAQGGYVVHGSGHLTVGTPIWAGVWVWDVATTTWVGRNVPAAPLLEPTPGTPPSGYNSYFESTDAPTSGHPYVPHTYDGLIYRSAANSGGADGALVRTFYAGSTGVDANAVHEFDLSSATAPPTRRSNGITMGGSSGSYPSAALDEARGGYWLMTYNGAGPLKFVPFSTFSPTNYAGVEFNAYGDQSLIYVPPRDCLVAMGRDGSGGVDLSLRVCPIVSGTPQGWTLVTQSGTPPADKRCGGVWSTMLGKIVCYEADGSYTVHKLTVPADLTSGTWVWSSETLTGAAGATPSANPTEANGAWGRFVEAPELGCFLWCDSISDAMQAWRLTV